MSELPYGWAKATLSELADFNPKHDPSKLGEAVSFVPMPAVNAESGTIEGAINRPLADVWKGFTHFAENDVIFAKITPCMENGKIAVAKGLTNGLGCGSTEFHVLRSNGSILPEFLWRFLRQASFRKDAEGAMTGAVGQRRVPTDYLKTSELPLPPLAEQRRIVAKLDALTARTARVRADLDRIPALSARYKQAVLAKAFCGELTGSDGAGWTEVSISEIAEVGTGSTPKRSQAAYYQDGAVPWVTSSVVNRAYVDSADQFITEQALRETNCKVFQPGTLLVAMYGEGQTRGRVSVLGIPAATNQALAAISITCDDVVRREYVYWFLRSQYLALRSAAAGGVQPNLNLGIIKATRIPVPPLAEQVEIVRLVDRAFGELDRMTAEATSALRLIGRLDQAMLAKAFMGELVSQDPADEPASVLLDRIRAERANAPKTPRGRRKAAA